jgi:TPR repeat protein
MKLMHTLKLIPLLILLVGCTPSEEEQKAHLEDLKEHITLGIEARNSGNFDEALKHFMLLSDEGVPFADAQLGDMYFFGEGVERDYAKAAKYYYLISKVEDYPMNFFYQERLADMYLQGLGLPVDFDKGIYWLTKAAEGGMATPQMKLAMVLSTEDFGRIDAAAAVKWCEGVATGESVKIGIKGDHSQTIAAQKMLAGFHEIGFGVPQDAKKRIHWLIKASELGDGESMFQLGGIYTRGEGVSTDLEKALKWTSAAAEQGYAEAQYILGGIYYNGEGASQDYKEATKWFTKAANQGHAEAQYSLGWMYVRGLGVTQDYEKAIDLWVKASSQGIGKATFQLARTFYQVQNYKEAVKGYTMAANQGDAEAQHNLGLMYCDGKGVPQDYAVAAEWYTKAAEQGLAEAQYNLGYSYANGYGVPQDYVQAHKWWNLAATSGLEAAKKARDIVVEEMAPEQIAEAQRLAREWWEEHGKKD